MSSDSDSWLSEYPDLLATGAVVIAFTIVIAGAKISVHFNSIFTVLNAIVLSFIIVAGLSFANLDYWTSDKSVTHQTISRLINLYFTLYTNYNTFVTFYSMSRNTRYIRAE